VGLFVRGILRTWYFSIGGKAMSLDALRIQVRDWSATLCPAVALNPGARLPAGSVRPVDPDLLAWRHALGSKGWSVLLCLREYGTEEQKLGHIPPIAIGDIAWCQGYSEPGAGSDLASLQTRAVDRGDFFEINGQKVWTARAQFAD
jgi:hypothetical protein